MECGNCYNCAVPKSERIPFTKDQLDKKAWAKCGCLRLREGTNMSVKTTVRVTLEIDTKQGWGDNCTMAQVKKQSMDSVNTILAKAFEKDPNHIKRISTVECINISYTEDIK